MRTRNWPAIVIGVCSLLAAGSAYADPADIAPLATDSLQNTAPLTFTPYSVVAENSGGTMTLAGDYDGVTAVSPGSSVDTVLEPITNGVNAGISTLDHAISSGAAQINSAITTARSMPDMPSMPGLPNVTSVLDPVTSAISTGVHSLSSLTGSVAGSLSNATSGTGGTSPSPFTPLTNLLGGLLGGAQSK